MLASLRRFAARHRGGRLTTYRDRYRIAALLSLLPLPLTRILALFGSDKQRSGGHAYGSTYHSVMAPFRYRSVKILEIGILYGESLLAWRCYFPFGTTIGVDIEPKPGMAGGRTRNYTADQGSGADLDMVCEREGPFDIIVDDGSHLSSHQIFTFERTFSSLKSGGVYVIEDVQTSFWPGAEMGAHWDGAHIGTPAFASTCYGVFVELAKYLNHAEFLGTATADPRLLALGRQITRIAFEHNLIIIWKGRNERASNTIRQEAAG